MTNEVRVISYIIGSDSDYYNLHHFTTFSVPTADTLFSADIIYTEPHTTVPTIWMDTALWVSCSAYLSGMGIKYLIFSLHIYRETGWENRESISDWSKQCFVFVACEEQDKEKLEEYITELHKKYKHKQNRD